MKNLSEIFESWFNNENAKAQDSLYDESIAEDEAFIDTSSDDLISAFGCRGGRSLTECKDFLE